MTAQGSAITAAWVRAGVVAHEGTASAAEQWGKPTPAQARAPNLFQLHLCGGGLQRVPVADVFQYSGHPKHRFLGNEAGLTLTMDV